jgi:hypothetical protein
MHVCIQRRWREDKLWTRKRLDEAAYFYNRLVGTQNDDEFYFNLSAFLSAWRSILDVMLYDFNEHYSLGFSTEDQLNDKEFKAVANALNKTQAREFIKWWRKKQTSLRKNPLWAKRNITAHRGYAKMSEYRIFVSGSGGTSGTISGVTGYLKRKSWPTSGVISPSDPTSYFFADMPDRAVMIYCDEALKEIESIITEAERTFSVKL